MFRLVIFTCFLHFSVSEIIRGRVLHNGDPARGTRISRDAILTVQLLDTSLADAPSTVLKQAEFYHLVAFPVFYEIEIPASISPAASYSLIAEIKKNDQLLYRNDQHVLVQMEADKPITIDIPVQDVNQDARTRKILDHRRKYTWPEMLGQHGDYAVKYIKEKSGLTNVFVIVEGERIDMDYQEDRVRVVTQRDGSVVEIPTAG